MKLRMSESKNRIQSSGAVPKRGSVVFDSLAIRKRMGRRVRRDLDRRARGPRRGEACVMSEDAIFFEKVKSDSQSAPFQPSENSDQIFSILIFYTLAAKLGQFLLMERPDRFPEKLIEPRLSVSQLPENQQKIKPPRNGEVVHGDGIEPPTNWV